MDDMEARIREVEQQIDRQKNTLDHHNDLLTDIRDAVREIQGSIHTLSQIQVEQSNSDKKIQALSDDLYSLRDKYYKEIPIMNQWREKTETLTYRIVGGVIIAAVAGLMGFFFTL